MTMDPQDDHPTKARFGRTALAALGLPIAAVVRPLCRANTIPARTTRWPSSGPPTVLYRNLSLKNRKLSFQINHVGSRIRSDRMLAQAPIPGPGRAARYR